MTFQDDLNRTLAEASERVEAEAARLPSMPLFDACAPAGEAGFGPAPDSITVTYTPVDLSERDEDW